MTHEGRLQAVGCKDGGRLAVIVESLIKTSKAVNMTWAGWFATILTRSFMVSVKPSEED